MDSALLNVALSMSNTLLGGTPNRRHIWMTLNFLLSSNCASCAVMVIGWMVAPLSRMKMPWALSAPE